MFFENFPKLISVKKCLIDNKIICSKMRIKRMFSSGEAYRGSGGGVAENNDNHSGAAEYHGEEGNQRRVGAPESHAPSRLQDRDVQICLSTTNEHDDPMHSNAAYNTQ